MKIRCIEIDVDTYDWQTKKITRIETIKAIEEKEVSDFKVWLKSLKSCREMCINEGDRVYFDSSVVFPRRKFAKAFPTNKMVNNPGDADVVIVDLDSLNTEFNHIYSSILYKAVGTNWTYYEQYLSPTSKINKRFFIQQSWGLRLEEVFIPRVNSLYEIEGKKLMDIRYLSLPSAEKLSGEAFDKLNKMLSSGDDQVKTMAMNMLTAYNYNEEKTKIALLLNLNWDNWASIRNRKENVEVKSLLRKLDLDMPNFRSGHDDIGFWLKVGVEGGDMDITTKAFNAWARKWWKDAPEIEIKIKNNDKGNNSSK